MTPEEIAALAAEIRKQNAEAEPAPAPEPTPAPAPEAAPAAFDPSTIVTQLTAVLDERNATSNNEAMDVLFEQQLQQAATTQPGFQEFLDQADDYGAVRKDKLTGITDYKQKVETLAKLQTSYSEAAANTPGRKPVVNTRERQIATDIEAKYADVYKRWDAGEITSEQQLAEEHAKVMSEEAAVLMGTGS